MQRRLLLDVVVRESAPVLELLARKDEPLLVRRDALLVLDLLLHRGDGVARVHVEGDGLAREGLDENLHSHDKCVGSLVLRLRCGALSGSTLDPLGSKILVKRSVAFPPMKNFQ